ncbi:asparaginase [Brevibacillus ruminantium]|uniref:asparaginase n=1 Tax=Brevibacillus ruminantium TaxID=2950604 RepID=A0ABY4WE45_9BACL|nr:asparaginase [Brevibacillus ruminantium]USG65009.1 asparaginase [Brevibacillus ruminantium]
MSKVVIIATGGTISGYSGDRLDLKDYKSGNFTAEDFLAAIPEIRQFTEVEFEQVTNFSSTNITPYHWGQLKEKIEHYLNDRDYDGVVVTHGTNTLEETAYFLHLTVNTDKPVVLVGAQRPFTALGSDAAINLLHAVRVAVHPSSHGKGVLVVLNDEINSARDVSKTNTYRLETFQSNQLGFLGYVDPDGTVQYYRSPVRKHTAHSIFASLPLQDLPEVAIVYSYAGADGEIIRSITATNKYRGIVTAGTGAGKISAEEEAALAEAAQKGIVIARSSRVGAGRVVDLACYRDYPFISGDNLLPQKARILLMLSLLVSDKREEIQQLFDEY